MTAKISIVKKQKELLSFYKSKSLKSFGSCKIDTIPSFPRGRLGTPKNHCPSRLNTLIPLYWKSSLLEVSQIPIFLFSLSLVYNKKRKEVSFLFIAFYFFVVFFKKGEKVYAESTFLPFARRALITALPPQVAILARKPWRRVRINLLGWYVLFICIAPWINYGYLG